jgi:hypothetical protein
MTGALQRKVLFLLCNLDTQITYLLSGLYVRGHSWLDSKFHLISSKGECCLSPPCFALGADLPTRGWPNAPPHHSSNVNDANTHKNHDIHSFLRCLPIGDCRHWAWIDMLRQTENSFCFLVVFTILSCLLSLATRDWWKRRKCRHSTTWSSNSRFREDNHRPMLEKSRK